VLDERATGVRDAGSERTGGQIRNNAVKQGRLLEPSDFGEYAELFGYATPAAFRRLRRWSTDLVWIWLTRDSVTPSTSPISARVSPSS
jgi:hypothetical protein